MEPRQGGNLKKKRAVVLRWIIGVAVAWVLWVIAPYIQWNLYGRYQLIHEIDTYIVENGSELNEMIYSDIYIKNHQDLIRLKEIAAGATVRLNIKKSSRGLFVQGKPLPLQSYNFCIGNGSFYLDKITQDVKLHFPDEIVQCALISPEWGEFLSRLALQTALQTGLEKKYQFDSGPAYVRHSGRLDCQDHALLRKLRDILDRAEFDFTEPPVPGSPPRRTIIIIDKGDYLIYDVAVSEQEGRYILTDYQFPFYSARSEELHEFLSELVGAYPEW